MIFLYPKTPTHKKNKKVEVLEQFINIKAGRYMYIYVSTFFSPEMTAERVTNR